jgi:hypothetical protein
MNRHLSVLFCVCVLSANLSAGEKVLTTPERVNLWAKDLAKELKKVKFKEAYVLYPDFADRSLDAIETAGLQTNSTIFPTLAADVQTALTRLKTDIQAIRDKRADVKKTIDDLARDLRMAANSATPPLLDVSARLILACYAAVNDGEIIEKERDTILELAAIVTATSGMPAQTITDINTHVAAVTASRGILKADIDLLAADLKAILDMTK